MKYAVNSQTYLEVAKHMDQKTIWGALFILYVLPYVAWIMSRDQTLEIRKKLYPGRDTEQKYEKNTTFYGVLWTAGILFLLIGWQAEWHPISTFVLLILVLASILFVKWSWKHWSPLSTRTGRYGVAGTGVWFLAVFAWFLIFQNHTDIEIHEAFMIGIFPPCIVFISLLAFRWAKKDSI